MTNEENLAKNALHCRSLKAHFCSFSHQTNSNAHEYELSAIAFDFCGAIRDNEWIILRQ